MQPHPEADTCQYEMHHDAYRILGSIKNCIELLVEKRASQSDLASRHNFMLENVAASIAIIHHEC